MMGRAVHGHTVAGFSSPTYETWRGMIHRCHNPKAGNWSRYGAKGVTVCDRWRYGEGGMSGFACFLADMGERPEGMTLDRERGHLGYCKDNCRWATREEQNANRVLANSMKDRCPHGHPYDGDNLYRRPNGHRVCRCCSKERRRHRERVLIDA